MASTTKTKAQTAADKAAGVTDKKPELALAINGATADKVEAARKAGTAVVLPDGTNHHPSHYRFRITTDMVDEKTLAAAEKANATKPK